MMCLHACSVAVSAEHRPSWLLDQPNRLWELDTTWYPGADAPEYLDGSLRESTALLCLAENVRSICAAADASRQLSLFCLHCKCLLSCCSNLCSWRPRIRPSEACSQPHHPPMACRRRALQWVRRALQSVSANLAWMGKLCVVSSSCQAVPAHALRPMSMCFAARVVLTSADVLAQARCHAGSGRHPAGGSRGQWPLVDSTLQSASHSH